ncbi:Uncharacterised protein [Vibrio cholerae]|nr:Uncharacterised protein [Vibrio cholerae]
MAYRFVKYRTFFHIVAQMLRLSRLGSKPYA